MKCFDGRLKNSGGYYSTSARALAIIISYPTNSRFQKVPFTLRPDRKNTAAFSGKFLRRSVDI